MKFDLKSQRIARQLQRLYLFKDCGEITSHSIYGDYSLLYDFLIEDGHKIDFDSSDKKKLYNFAKIAFKRDKKNWIPLKPGDEKERHEAFLKRELEKYYKSFLAMKYLLDRYNQTGETLKLHYEDGTEVKLVEITLKD